MTAPPRYYVIGIKYGRSEDMLPQMKAAGVISTGFLPNIDLSGYIGQDRGEVEAGLRQALPAQGGTALATVARLASLRPGDVIALKAHSAPRGYQPRLVIAAYAVVRGRATAEYVRLPELGHGIRVDFLADQEPIELPFGYGQTLHEVSEPQRISAIYGPYAPAARRAYDESGRNADKATHESLVDARGAYIMRRVHNDLQNELRRRLNEAYGPGAVAQEADFIDLSVRLKDSFLLFEVKASPSPVSCIREALGQVMHYAWRVGLRADKVKFIVAGPSLLTDSDAQFLAYIRASTGLLLHYCSPSSFDPKVL